jgi:hypothetical protein
MELQMDLQAEQCALKAANDNHKRILAGTRMNSKPSSRERGTRHRERGTRQVNVTQSEECFQGISHELGGADTDASRKKQMDFRSRGNELRLILLVCGWDRH